MNLKLKSYVLNGICLALVASLVGCGSSSTVQPNPVDKNQQTESVPQDKVAQHQQPGSEAIEGTWLGLAFLDETALARELESLSPQRQAEVLQSAEMFVSTQVALSLSADGEMVHEVAIHPPQGPTVQESVKGTWKVIERKGREFRLQCVETSKDGTTTTVEKTCQIYEDGKNMSLVVAMDGILSRCNPMIVFEKQVPEAETASRPTGIQ